MNERPAAGMRAEGRSMPASGNQTRTPQQGHGASPGGRDGSSLNASPQTGQRLSSPSGVRDEMTISRSSTRIRLLPNTITQRTGPAERPTVYCTTTGCGRPRSLECESWRTGPPRVAVAWSPRTTKLSEKRLHRDTAAISTLYPSDDKTPRARRRVTWRLPETLPAAVRSSSTWFGQDIQPCGDDLQDAHGD